MPFRGRCRGTTYHMVDVGFGECGNRREGLAHRGRGTGEVVGGGVGEGEPVEGYHLALYVFLHTICD